MDYIVLDLEFNQAFDFQDGKPVEKIPECPFEIIQIGAVKLDKNFEIADKFEILIKPQIYTRLHPIVERITGISEAMLAHQEDFSRAYDKFLEFIDNKRAILVVWGGNDVKELYKNIFYYKLDHTKAPIKYINIQGVASSFFKNNRGVSIGLKNAVEGLEIEENMPFHNALNDAMYTAHIFQKLKKESLPIQKFNVKQLTKPSLKIKKSGLNTEKLYSAIEKEMGRKLNAKEKKLFKSVYFMGRSKKFDN